MSRRTRLPGNPSQLFKGGEIALHFKNNRVLVAILMRLFVLAADMNAHLDDPKESLIRRDTRAAGGDIRKAARSVKKEAEHAGNKMKIVEGFVASLKSCRWMSNMEAGSGQRLDCGRGHKYYGLSGAL
jgi:hypothetical protein